MIIKVELSDMVYIMAKMRMPTCKAGEAGQLLAVEGPKFNWKRFGGGDQDEMYENLAPNACRMTLQGGEIFTLVKVKPGKLESALKALQAWYAVFTRIEGIEVSVDLWYPLEEAGEMLAASIPGAAVAAAVKPAPATKAAKPAK